MYLDIHTHTFYRDDETTLLLNAFPSEPEKLEYPVYLSVGLHPWNVSGESWEKDIEMVKKAAAEDKVLAIGEAGLDKSVKTDYALQHNAFAAQIAISESNQKPMIIHCVRAYSELLAYRKRSDQSLPWIFHWFNSDVQMAGELIRKNCYLSFGHMLFNRQSKAYRAFPDIPAGNIFFETDDAGYTIQEVYAQAATMRNTEVRELKEQILSNFTRCFHK